MLARNKFRPSTLSRNVIANNSTNRFPARAGGHYGGATAQQSFNFSGCATDLYDPLENVHDETQLMIQLWVVQYPLGPICPRGRFSGDQRAGSVNALRFITKNVLLFWWKKIKFTDWSGQYWLCRLLNPWSEPERPNSRPFSHGPKRRSNRWSNPRCDSAQRRSIRSVGICLRQHGRAERRRMPEWRRAFRSDIQIFDARNMAELILPCGCSEYRKSTLTSEFTCARAEATRSM